MTEDRLIVLKLRHLAMYVELPGYWKEVLNRAAERLEEKEQEDG